MTDDISRLTHAIRRHGSFDGFVEALTVEERDSLLDSLTREHQLRGFTHYTVKEAGIKRLSGGGRYFYAKLLDKDSAENTIGYGLDRMRDVAIRSVLGFTGVLGLPELSGVRVRQMIHNDFEGPWPWATGKHVYMKATPRIGHNGRAYEQREFRSIRGRGVEYALTWELEDQIG